MRGGSAEGGDAEALSDHVDLQHRISRRRAEIDARLAFDDFSGHGYPFDQRTPDHGQRGRSDRVVALAADRRHGTPRSHRLSSPSPGSRTPNSSWSPPPFV